MRIDWNDVNRFNCELCPNRCDGRSKSAYLFHDDVALSEEAEDRVLSRLENVLGLTVRKTPAEAHGLPDLEVVRGGAVVARVEVKAQGRAFMSVGRLLPKGDLQPHETVALNLSDLERYLALHAIERIPTFIIWRVRRPCIGEGYWGERIEALEAIYRHYGANRRFQRASTTSDIVDGRHKGVTVNYHFSLRELRPAAEIVRMLAAL